LLSVFGQQCRHQCHVRTPEIYHPGQPLRSVQTVPQVDWLAEAWRSRYPPAWTPSIITAAATAKGRVTRSVIPSVEPPCFYHLQGVPCKPCASPWLTKPHGQLTRCPPRQPSAIMILKSSYSIVDFEHPVRHLHVYGCQWITLIPRPLQVLDEACSSVVLR